MDKNIQYRQGDVFMVRVEELPKGCTPLPHTILALGEVTGHAHRVLENAVLYEAEQVLHRYLEVLDGGATVSHEEHGAIVLDPGVYEVRIQREWDDGQERRVAD